MYLIILYLEAHYENCFNYILLYNLIITIKLINYATTIINL